MTMPFPGMDTYLEHPALWPGVHTRLIVALANQLGQLIEPRYVASVEDRVFLEEHERQRAPDVWVQKVRDESRVQPAATALATPVLVEVEQLEVHEHCIEILDLYRNQRVVTVIELVSPSNKAAGPGRDSYLAKQRATLASECHLVEIDLLRRGRHVLSIPPAGARGLRPYDYLVCVSRWPARRVFAAYRYSLRDRLLPFPVPLADPDPDAPLDVPAALEQVYAEGRYDLRVLYDQPCQPRLRPDDQRWADERWAAYRAAHPNRFPATRQGPASSPLPPG
jgi:hypothetical protein